MARVHVFAGLGPDDVFSDATQKRAVQDSVTPNGQVLLSACHRAFIDELSLNRTEASALRIDLDDFELPDVLLRPDPKYYRNPVIQNATLCLVQLLRYQTCALRDGAFDVSKNVATTGFCAGLFAAVAAATARDPLQYLLRAEQCFRLATIVGLASEKARRVADHLLEDLPWSVFANNITAEEVTALASEAKADVYVTALNAPACVTVSGNGQALEEFTQKILMPRCNVSGLSVFSPFHSPAHLAQSRDDILHQLGIRNSSFPTKNDLSVPVISNIDGSMIHPKQGTQESSLLADILDMVLIAPTNWVAVEETILYLANGYTEFSVRNYGPRYGALACRKDIPPGVSITDVSLENDYEDSALDDIAIVGIGIDLPDAPDPDVLWQNLMSGLNSCSEIPTDRFRFEDYYTGDGCKPVNHNRSMGTKYGSFLKEPFLFDHQLFGISPREASSIDPQQRLVLSTVYRALESAGYVADSTPSTSRDSFGCFIGNATLDYTDNLRQDIDVYYSPGTLRAFLSGRVSYAFKWSGPSATIDTACSSSLLAIYQAARALVAGDCRAAVAGGVNVITSPDMYMGLDKGHFLSPTGQCKAFDESADGYCRSEGCTIFVLKRLADAVAENDDIRGVIKGIEVNQSGQASSITHPHSSTQARLFRRLLSSTAINPKDVSVVEAHGTGTQAGDPNELRSIRGVFAEARTADNPLFVTSIKSNIGHAEAASGGAGLAKLLMMLKHKRIPPQILLNNLNPAIERLDVDGTIIATESQEWKLARSKKRTALLNNFGAAGSNAALLLEEYQQPVKAPSMPQKRATYVFGCSARSSALLELTRDSFLDCFRHRRQELDLADVCYTSTARRGLQRFRLSVTASSLTELSDRLAQAEPVEVDEKQQPRTSVFLFGGQGSQYVGMGKDLLELSAVFRKTVLKCDRLLLAWGFPSCCSVIESTQDEIQDQRSPEMLQALQVAVFVIEVALARLLASLNIRPDIVAGHSLGEYAALVVAGVLELEGGLWLVAERARLIVEKCRLWETAMLAINMSAADARESVLNLPQFSDLAISCENSPSDCVIGGNRDVLYELQHYITGQLKKRCSLLDVPIAYHTPALLPIAEDLEKAAARIQISRPVLPIASNVLGRVVQPGESVFTTTYFAEHCIKSVSFDGSIADIVRNDKAAINGIWMELAPHPTLLPMAAHHLTEGTPDKIATLNKHHNNASKTMSDLLCLIYRNATENTKWRGYFEGMPSKPRLIELPQAPMDMRRFLVPLAREAAAASMDNGSAETATEQTPSSFLQRDTSSKDVTSFETSIDALKNHIQGHMVCGSALCPASVYTEMAVAAAIMSNSPVDDDTTFKLQEIGFVRPLLYHQGSRDNVRIVLSPKGDGQAIQSYEVYSYPEHGDLDEAKLHCTGKIKIRSLSHVNDKLRKVESALVRRRRRFQNDACQTFSSNVMYKKIFSRVVDYSSDYHAVSKIFLDDDFQEIYAQCQLPIDESGCRYAGQPILLDTMLHVAGFAANISVDNDTVCIAHRVHSVTMFRQNIVERQNFEVHCSNFTSPTKSDYIIADVHAADDQGVIATIKGIEFHRSKLAKIRAAFQHVSRAPPNINTTLEPRSSEDLRALKRLSVSSYERSVSLESRSSRSSPHTSETSPSITPGNTTLYTILAEATGVEANAITPRTELSAMGVDSMMVFELEKILRDILDPKPTVGEISACSTVRDMENLVSARMSAMTRPRTSTPLTRTGGRRSRNGISPRAGNTPLDFPQLPEPNLPQGMIDILQQRLGAREQPEQIQSQPGPSNQPPLYLFAPGAGITMHYTRMSPLRRNVFTVQDACLLANHEDDWKSIDEAARHYASMVTRHASQTSSRPGIILGGWSFGGIIAFETARHLAHVPNLQVHGVVLIDAPPPFGHVPIARETIETAMAYTQKKSSRPRPKSVTDFEDAIAKLTIRNNLRRAALLACYEPARTGPMPQVILLRSSEGLMLPNAHLLPENKWLHDRSDVGVCVDAWNELLGKEIPVIDIPGDHFHPFEAENVKGTTEAIRQACEMLFIQG